MGTRPNCEARSESGWKRRADKLRTRRATRSRRNWPSGLPSPSASVNSIGFEPPWASAIHRNLRKKSELFSQGAAVAATHETDLLSQLEGAFPIKQPHATVQEPAPQHRLHPNLRLLLTLVLLTAVGLHRRWDLRTYTGSELGRLSGRPQPYSYRHVERFLRILAIANAEWHGAS